MATARRTTNEQELALAPYSTCSSAPAARATLGGRLLTTLRSGRAREAEAEAALLNQIRNTPPAGKTPRHPLGAYAGSFGHPGYGTARVKLVSAPNDPPHLELCDAAALWHTSRMSPGVPSCGRLLHVYYETFALGPTSLEQVGTGTLMLTFDTVAYGDVVTAFTAPVEPSGSNGVCASQ